LPLAKEAAWSKTMTDHQNMPTIQDALESMETRLDDIELRLQTIRNEIILVGAAVIIAILILLYR
jgi:hypothetical protein